MAGTEREKVYGLTCKTKWPTAVDEPKEGSPVTINCEREA